MWQSAVESGKTSASASNTEEKCSSSATRRVLTAVCALECWSDILYSLIKNNLSRIELWKLWKLCLSLRNTCLNLVVADCGSLAYCVMCVSMFVSMFVFCVFALCQGLSPSSLNDCDVVT